MRKLVMVLVFVVSLCLGGLSFAGKGGNKSGDHGNGGGHRGPSERAYERASDNAAFKRTKDWEPGVHPSKPKKKHDDENGEDRPKKDKRKKKDRKDKDDDHDEDENHEDHESSDDHSPSDSLTNQTGS